VTIVHHLAGLFGGGGKVLEDFIFKLNSSAKEQSSTYLATGSTDCIEKGFVANDRLP